MENEKRKNLIIVLLVIIILLLGTLIFLILSGKVDFKKQLSNDVNNNEPINNVVDKNDNTIDSNNNSVTNIFDYTNIPVENGYTEVNLTNEEKAKINSELYKELKPGAGNDPIIRWSNYNINENILKEDCNKLLFVRWYISHNNNTGYKYEKIEANFQNVSGLYKMKYSQLEEITKEIFNVNTLSCHDKEQLVLDNDGYIGLDPAGGGFVPVAIKALSKYENNNNYYLLIHMYFPTIKRANDGSYTGNWEDLLTSYEDENNVTENSKYIKLKYGIKDDNTKYLISFEYLN